MKKGEKMNRGCNYVVAGSIYVVEALKDQGIARWDYPLRCLHRRLNNNFRSFLAQSGRASGAPASGASAEEREKIKQRKTQECVNKVMEMSCFGPSTTRF